MTRITAENAWLPGGWRRDVALDIGPDGRLAAVGSGAPHARWVLPGVPNLHSHAFQRAMAGLAERQTHPEDSFWTWREVMYGFAGRVGPEALRDIAAMLYVEMLEAGYTSVCEFHYLHHAPDGAPYADPAVMSLALVEAAREAGIGLTLLPALYVTGGFDGRPLSPRQRRFGHDADRYLRLLERLRPLDDGDRLRVGACFHSLRAVPPDALRAVLDALPPDVPVHLHVAEQEAEVQDCLATRGARPVEWLLDHAAVDARWTLVHATHMTGAETGAVAASGATVAICPTTEANLGDGLFPLRDYIDAGGCWGVGSDSHVSVSPVEELRWLEYGQRLRAQRRNVAVTPDLPSTGECLYAHALAGGLLGTRQPVGALVTGARADLLVLDDAAPELAGRDAAHLLDTWLFSGNRPLVREVYVAGRRVVADGRHERRDAVAARYRATVAALATDRASR